MTENDAFLRAIIENPEDDAPRLMYADWLEERGDPRAEFIRVQYALEHMSEDNDRWPTLEERERELLTTFGEVWAGRVRELATDWTFRRGFVERVSVEARMFLTRGNELFWLTPIRQVELLGASHLARDLAACPHLRQVHSLDVSQSGLGLWDLALLLNSPHLDGLRGLCHSLHLPTAADLRDVGRLPLHRFPALHLSLNVTSQEAAAGVARLTLPPGLRSLTLTGHHIGDEGLRVLAHSPLAARLTALCLPRNDVGARGVAALATSEHLTRLAYLDLTANTVSLAGIRSLAGAEHLKSLRKLNLKENSLGEEGLKALTDSPHLNGLTVLDLGWNLLSAAGACILAESPILTSVRELALPSNGLGDDGAEAVARSPHLTRLAVLSLDNNRIGPRGARALASSPHLRRLTQLGLRTNPIGNMGAEALLASPYLTRLQSLGHVTGLGSKVAGRIRARFPNDYVPRHESRP